MSRATIELINGIRWCLELLLIWYLICKVFQKLGQLIDAITAYLANRIIVERRQCDNETLSRK